MGFLMQMCLPATGRQATIVLWLYAMCIHQLDVNTSTKKMVLYSSGITSRMSLLHSTKVQDKRGNAVLSVAKQFEHHKETPIQVVGSQKWPKSVVSFAIFAKPEHIAICIPKRQYGSAADLTRSELQDDVC